MGGKDNNSVDLFKEPTEFCPTLMCPIPNPHSLPPFQAPEEAKPNKTQNTNQNNSMNPRESSKILPLTSISRKRHMRSLLMLWPREESHTDGVK